MKLGKNTDAIIEVLNEILTGELTAINQYFLHGEICENWGYKKLHKVIRGHSIGEMKHADTLVERILFLDGLPNVQRLGDISVGESVPEMFKVDLALEVAAVERLNVAIETCRTSSDNGTRHILEEILESEEEHVDWIEAQLELLEQVGVENYLAEQIHE